jgi:hypothetical protein
MKPLCLALAAAALLLCATVPASAGIPTPHLIPLQGRALDSSGEPLATGDVAVRIYAATTGDSLVYDSGTQFAGAVQEGVFNVLLGEGTSLELDNTRPYYLEVDVNGQEVLGDAVTGRQAFYPGGGSHERADFESRIATLESLVLVECEAGTYDLDGNPANGCEFTLDPQAIYVSVTDPGAMNDATCGLGPTAVPGCHPCASIGQGLARAVMLARARVLVADGVYEENVTLTNGVSLLGGYDPDDWTRHVATTSAVLHGSGSGTSHMKTVVGSGISATTTVEGFVIYGRPAPVSYVGGAYNSYAVWLSNSPGVRIVANTIVGGLGGPGLAGTDGGGPYFAGPGGAGADVLDTGSYDCTTLSNPGGSAGVGSGGSAGGPGGTSQCPIVYGARSGSGTDGLGSAMWRDGAGGTGGIGGWNHAVQTPNICLTGEGSADGGVGGDGGDGLGGEAGFASSSAMGSIYLSEWLGGGGSPGGYGGRGGGGGGGGAGGGVYVEGAITHELLGASGGGGGGGGAGGVPGEGGRAGGGSLGVLVTGGAAPVIEGNIFWLGYGGPAGRGGHGSRGTSGGAGGEGGGMNESLAYSYCAGLGGAGGKGGDGGWGGGGAGGNGGIACGIFTSGVSGLPSYAVLNTFSGGMGGVGATGGWSGGDSGADGYAGSVINCNNQ